MRDGQTVQRPQLLSARLHLIGLGGGSRGQFRDQGHDRIDLRVDPLNLRQVRGQRLSCRELLRADQSGHLDGAHETHRRRAGLGLERARKERQRRQAHEDVAAGGMVLTHGRNPTPTRSRCLYLTVTGEDVVGCKDSQLITPSLAGATRNVWTE